MMPDNPMQEERSWCKFCFVKRCVIPVALFLFCHTVSVHAQSQPGALGVFTARVGKQRIAGDFYGTRIVDCKEDKPLAKWDAMARGVGYSLLVQSSQNGDSCSGPTRCCLGHTVSVTAVLSKDGVTAYPVAGTLHLNRRTGRYGGTLTSQNENGTVTVIDLEIPSKDS